MTNVELWAEALDYSGRGEDLPSSVLRHVRDAVWASGFVRRGSITSGLKEAYAPLGIDVDALRTALEEAITLLLHAGDIDELATGAGRGYAPTPPRRVKWGGSVDAVLGATGESSRDAVRRISAEDVRQDLIAIHLRDELGRPDWRNALVELGGADAQNGDATTLSEYACALTRSGDRFTLDDPQTVAVLSRGGDFFGRAQDLSGRWSRPGGEGFFPAVVKAAYHDRYVFLWIQDGDAAMWEPPSRDIWNWIVVGCSLSQNSPVWRYDQEAEKLEFLTPPPRQVERGAMLTGTRLGAWSWQVDRSAQAIIAGLIGCPTPS